MHLSFARCFFFLLKLSFSPGRTGGFQLLRNNAIKIGASPKEKAPKPIDKNSALLDIAVIIYSVVEFSDIFTEIIQPQHGGISAHII